MALTDTLLALTDFQDIKEVSVNLNDARILPYVREAQRIELVKFLGEAQYYALLDQWDSGDSDFDGDTDMQALWDGASYTYSGQTVHCHGLKLVLLYYSLARFMKQQDINITSYGVRILNDGDLSEREQMSQIRTKAGELMSIAFIYQDECRRYLDANVADFTLWGTTSSTPKQMSFKMIKVT